MSNYQKIEELIVQTPKLFKINGNPAVFSPNQQKIFNLIVGQQYPRCQIIAPTQYGKSLTVALAILMRTALIGDRFTILAPSEKKASIIMEYVIDHCFDSPLFLNRLELEPNVTLDRLRRERSRNHLTFIGNGGVQILTLDARNSKRSIEAALGFGGNRLILDESSLIDDPLYATVKRMLGGYKYKDTFLLEIGNPFYRNHFYRTWHDDNYNKIFIDYNVGLAEGRYSPEFIEEMRNEAFFDVFYECRFPDEDTIDSKGYRQLITTEELEATFVGTLEIDKNKRLKLGVDVAGGGDYNVFTLRQGDQTWVESTNRSNDTMTNVNEVVRLIDEYTLTMNGEKKRLLLPEEVYIDDIGIGRGVTDRLIEMGYNINGISVGETPQDKTKYKNVKAENYWLAQQWVKAGGKILKRNEWQQLTWIKYKVSTDKVLQIEPKQELKQRNGKSPDFAEAFMLTFSAPKPQPNIRLL
ncbi:MAG TPA: hypothetical protein VNW29_04115 [Candidatus Sulfotelmatobacter sp.]|jgi:hypothetical protein|nr:hypothetical protein [Candidatus Sulfotelmatobacter sp.]